MRVLTDRPVRLSQWREFSDESAEVESLGAAEAVLWQALVGEDPAWELEFPLAGSPAGLGFIAGHVAGSQFDSLHRLLRGGHRLPACVMAAALEGDGFHGQGDRPWIAEAGNLHLSVYFKTDLPAAGALAAIPVLPTLAVMDAFGIRANADERTGIRWVNDVFVRGRKLAGSIAVSEVEADRVQGLLFGIGVNVERVPSVPGDVFVPEATSLRSACPEGAWSLGKALAALMGALTARVEEFMQGKGPNLVEVFAQRSACIGREVKVWPKQTADAAQAAPLAVGRLTAIGRDLSIRVGGQSVATGRLAFAEDCERFGL